MFPDSKNPAVEAGFFYVSGTDAPEAIVRAKGFKQVSDRGELDSLIDRVLGEQAPSAVNDFRAGQSKAMGFLIGQVMQASGE